MLEPRFGIKIAMSICFVHGETSKTVNQLKQTPGVFIVSSALGDYEAYAELMFKSFIDLSEKITAIKKNLNIQKISFALSTNEDSLLPPKFDLFK